MLNLTSRTAHAWRSVQRLAAGMATAVEGKIGDTKVPMSLLEKGAFINYQRIEDNLAIVRQRYFSLWYLRRALTHPPKAATPLDPLREDPLRPS